MKGETFFKLNGEESLESKKYYRNIVNCSEELALQYTPIALELAITLHDGTYRDGGEPYIIHPLETANYLILLNIRNSIFEMNKNNLHNEKLAETQTIRDIDILLSSMLLHDTLEDCIDKLEGGESDFIKKYHLHPDILKYVKIMTKNKNVPGYSIEDYFEEIETYWQTLIMKLVDRGSNCSTISVFEKKRMEKYVYETEEFFYSMIAKGKIMYPYFSRIFTIVKYLMVSICESVSAVLNLDRTEHNSSYEKTFYFINGFAIGKGEMPNLLKALPLSRKYYTGLTRKSGDQFIIHPLRVCSYLISLKIDSDDICAAALLHEIIKHCHLDYNGIEILTDYHVDPIVLDYIRLMANCEGYTLDLYYEALKQYPAVMLLKLSNRAHTCTTLTNSSDEEIRKYVDECEKYIYPLCEYGVSHYPEYSYAIQLMWYHIRSVCNVVKSLRLSL